MRLSKYKVCLDPGHGTQTGGKRSPDGTYLEHEFALDMAFRMKGILEKHGVEVYLTRQDENDIDLAKRCAIANAIKDLDLFISLHSNAYGSGKEWTDPKGYCIYTSSAGDGAARNRAAKAIIARIKEAGITLRPHPLVHEAFYVLRNTVAPAVLIEHGFHTNKKETKLLKTSWYRDKLALANCRGILDYMGIKWRGVDEVLDIKDIDVTVGNTTIKAKLIDGVTYVSLREFVDVLKKELEVTWDNIKGAGVKL